MKLNIQYYITVNIICFAFGQIQQLIKNFSGALGWGFIVITAGFFFYMGGHFVDEGCFLNKKWKVAFVVLLPVVFFLDILLIRIVPWYNDSAATAYYVLYTLGYLFKRLPKINLNDVSYISPANDFNKKGLLNNSKDGKHVFIGDQILASKILNIKTKRYTEIPGKFVDQSITPLKRPSVVIPPEVFTNLSPEQQVVIDNMQGTIVDVSKPYESIDIVFAGEEAITTIPRERYAELEFVPTYEDPILEPVTELERQDSPEVEQVPEQLTKLNTEQQPQTLTIGKKEFRIEQRDGVTFIPFVDGKDETKTIEGYVDTDQYDVVPIKETVPIEGTPAFAKIKTQEIVQGVEIRKKDFKR